jgi:predicted transcriptional regulator
MAKAKEIQGVSPIIVPGYADMIARNVKGGAKVDLILTDNILKIVCEQHCGLLKDLLMQDNFRLYRTDLEVKVAFTVTESMLDLGLFRLDGSYDLGADLVCIGEGSINWGRELFEHYRSLSQIVDDPEFISNIAMRMRG